MINLVAWIGGDISYSFSLLRTSQFVELMRPPKLLIWILRSLVSSPSLTTTIAGEMLVKFT